VIPPEATHVDAEAELAVEIGRGGRRIAMEDALDHVSGDLVEVEVEGIGVLSNPVVAE